MLPSSSITARSAGGRGVLLFAWWVAGFLAAAVVLHQCQRVAGAPGMEPQGAPRAAASVPGDKPVSPALSAAATEPSAEFHNESLRGRVVWLAEALEREFGISTVPEVAENSLALQTDDGRLIPIVENVRGRAFRKDERLREVDVEMLVRRHERQPLVQILRVYLLEDGQLYEVDYWCDICAITMFETGACACCQDQNVLRKRLVKEVPPP